MALRLDLVAEGNGLKNIEAELQAIRKRLDNVKPLLSAISTIYYQSTMERFRSHTDPQGRSWKHLKPRTIADKRRLPSVESPYFQLIRTGDMRSAIRVRHVDAKTISIGLRTADIPYAAHHQYGAPNGNIPQRKFLGVTKAANTQVRRLMEKFVQGQNLSA